MHTFKQIEVNEIFHDLLVLGLSNTDTFRLAKRIEEGKITSQYAVEVLRSIGECISMKTDFAWRECANGVTKDVIFYGPNGYVVVNATDRKIEHKVPFVSLIKKNFNTETRKHKNFVFFQNGYFNLEEDRFEVDIRLRAA